MEVLAVVAARGGRQRVPFKNILPILGRPTLCHTLDHVRAANLVQRIVVSTEDPRIAQVARSAGALVLDRPAALSTPEARLDGVLRHAVNSVSDARFRPDAIALLYAAVPIRPQGFIDHCISLLKETGADSVRSVAPVGEHHPSWMVKLDIDKKIEEFLGRNKVYRRQELPPLFRYTGAALVVKTDVLMGQPDDSPDPYQWLGTDQRGAVHAPEDCVEIHEPIDALWAEFLLQRRSENAKAHSSESNSCESPP